MIDRQIINQQNWQDHLTVTVTKNCVKVNGSVGNAELILTFDPSIAGTIRFNEFANTIETIGAPWGRTGAWTDYDTAQVKTVLEKYRAQSFSDKSTIEALTIVAHQTPFHPVRDYLNGLTWDGISRLETLLSTHLGTDENDLMRHVGACIMAKAVQRIFEPGCDCQFVPVLIGSQGCGKSSFPRILAGPWVNDSVISIGSKDGYMTIQGSWLVEVAEMQSFSTKKMDSVKAFISSPKDTYRPPYGKTREAALRQCMFIGTTNEGLCLRDSTGNRRFWPIECHATKDDVQSRNQWLENNRDQLWAEAVHFYLNDFGTIQTWIGEIGEQMEASQSNHNITDPLEEEYLSFLDYPRPKNWGTLKPDERHDFFQFVEKGMVESWYASHGLSHDDDIPLARTCVHEFCRERLGYTNGASHQTVIQRVARMLANNPDWTLDPQIHRYNNHGRKYYVRKKI